MECLAWLRLACGQVGEQRLGGGAGGPVVPRVVPPRAQGRAAMVSPFLLALLWSLGVDSISLAVSAVSTFRAAGGVTLSPRSAPLAPAPPCSGSAKQPRTRPAPHRAMRAAGPAGRRGRGGVVLEIRLEKLRRSRGVAAARPCPPSADQLCPLSSKRAKCPASLRRAERSNIHPDLCRARPARARSQRPSRPLPPQAPARPPSAPNKPAPPHGARDPHHRTACRRGPPTVSAAVRRRPILRHD